MPLAPRDRKIVDSLWEKGYDLYPKDGAYQDKDVYGLSDPDGGVLDWVNKNVLLGPMEIGDYLESQKFNPSEGGTGGLARNAALSIGQVVSSTLAIPGMLLNYPVETLKGFLEFVPNQVVTIWKAIRPYVDSTLTDDGRKKAMEDSSRAWELLYRDPVGPILALTMLRGGIKFAAGKIKGVSPGVSPIEMLRATARTAEERLVRRSIQDKFPSTKEVTEAKAILESQQGKGEYKGVPIPEEVSRWATDTMHRQSKQPFEMPDYEQALLEDRFRGVEEYRRINKIPEGDPIPYEEWMRDAGIKDVYRHDYSGPRINHKPVRDPLIMKLLAPVRARVKSPMLRGVLDMIDDMYSRKSMWLGFVTESAKEFGLADIKPGGFTRAMRKHSSIDTLAKTPEYRAFMDFLFEKAAALGIQVLKPIHGKGGKRTKWQLTPLTEEYIEGYFPIMIQDGIRKKLFREMYPIINNVAENLLSEEASMGKAHIKSRVMGFEPKAATKLMHKMMGNLRESFSPQLKSILEHMKTRGGVADEAEAMIYLWRTIDVERRGGHLFSARAAKGDFPSEILEMNPRKVMSRYMDDYARSMAEFEVFGDLKEVGSMLETGALQEPLGSNGVRLVQDALDIATGVMERKVGTTFSGLQNKYAAFTYMTKIGFGFSPALQVLQPLISTVYDAGVLRFGRAMIGLMNKGERRNIRMFSGAIAQHSPSRIMGQLETPGGILTNMVPGAKMFTVMNKMLDYLSAETSKVLVQDLHKYAQGSGKKASWAKDRLSEFGIDPTRPLSDAKMYRSMFEYTRDMQLHPRLTEEPAFFNHPRWRWTVMLKRFAYKQAKLTAGRMIREARRGNFSDGVFGPMLRLAGGGYLGGELADWARTKYRDTFTGRKQLDREDPLLLKAIASYSAIGAFGVLSDLGRIKFDDPDVMAESFIDQVRFTVAPVPFSDLMGTTAVLSDLMKGEGERAGIEAARLGGGLPGMIASSKKSMRLMTEELGKTKNEALRVAASSVQSGDYKRAVRVINNWNNVYTDFFMQRGVPRTFSGVVRKLRMRDVLRSIHRETLAERREEMEGSM